MQKKREPASLAVIVSMVDGLESFVKREVEALAGRGCHIALFATTCHRSEGFNPPPDMPLYRRSFPAACRGLLATLLLKPALFTTLLLESLRFRAVPEFLLALSWQTALRTEATELIHCSFGDRKYFTGYFLHRLTGLPLTVTIHAHEIYAQPNPAMFRHCIPYTSRFIAISHTNARLLQERCAVPPERIATIKLALNTTFWRPTGAIKVLTVARFTPRKGWAELIEAARLLGSGFHFFAVGFGELDLPAMAAEAGVDERFTVFPKLQAAQLRLLMEACDVFCLPSRPTREEGSEGIPVALMEAMAMGMPVITTDDGSIAELVDHVRVRPGDPQALAEALQEMAEQISGITAIKEETNREKVLQEHGPANIDRLVECFSEVLSAHARH